MADRAIRATQLADQMRDYLASWVRIDFPSELLSVTSVTLRPNLRDATVWVSCYRNEDILRLTKKVKAKERFYQKKLNATMQRRGLPNIHFTVTGLTDTAEPFSPQLLK